jgi:ABC-type multidrug transport system ATPase subunit
MMESFVLLDHVTKSYARTQAVRDISLSMSSAEVVGFAGPNGAGKSTISLLIAGFLHT